MPHYLGVTPRLTRAIMMTMATIRMSEAELARDVPAALAKVRAGDEVVIEQDHEQVAVLKSLADEGRSITDCIALAEARGSNATLDEGFMKDVEDGIAERSKPWTPPAWE